MKQDLTDQYQSQYERWRPMPEYSRIWTAHYNLAFGGGCYNIQFGKRNGPKIHKDTALKLAKKFLRKDPKLQQLYCCYPGSKKLNGW